MFENSLRMRHAFIFAVIIEFSVIKWHLSGSGLRDWIVQFFNSDHRIRAFSAFRHMNRWVSLEIVDSNIKLNTVERFNIWLGWISISVGFVKKIDWFISLSFLFFYEEDREGKKGRRHATFHCIEYTYYSTNRMHIFSLFKKERSKTFHIECFSQQKGEYFCIRNTTQHVNSYPTHLIIKANWPLRHWLHIPLHGPFICAVLCARSHGRLKRQIQPKSYHQPII